jgi:hypothetical protein
MKVVLDFDGIGDSKIKRILLSLVNKAIEEFKLSNFIDKFLWVWILNRDNDKEKISKIEEFAQKLRESYEVEVLILSARKVHSRIAIPLNSVDPRFKIEELKKLCKDERVIYYTDSEREIKAIKNEMQEMLRNRKLKVIKV